MRSNDELFTEHIVLNEKEFTIDKIYNSSPLKDFVIDEFILIRIYESISITFLHSGYKYTIPIEYYNIFKDFSFYNFSSLNKYEEYPLGKFIYEMSHLHNMILKNFKDSNSDEIIEIINNLSTCTTNSMREIIYNKLKITIGKINYESLIYDKLY